MRFVDRLNESGILVVDGAMGTMLQAEGITGCPELAALEHPESLTRIHQAYEEAGADIHTTNTFGGNRFKLAAYGLADRVLEINRTAAQITRAAVKGLVAGSMGPTGRLMVPYGDLSFDEAYSAFFEQAKALAEGGCDLIVVETMADLLEAKAALLAAKETGLPVVVSLTYSPDGRTLSGTSPEVAATVLYAAGATVVGANCSVGPQGMIPWVRAMREIIPLVSAAPNAGMPLFDGKNTRYEETPELFGQVVRELASAGARLIGGCCGTTPVHIKAVRAALDGFVPNREAPKPLGRLASRSKLVSFEMPRVIGERLNPTGKPKLQEALLNYHWATVQAMAEEQAQAGAELLDVNISLGEGDAVRMKMTVEALVDAVELPLVLDSSDPVVLEAGLKAYPGKALINSVSGEEAKLSKVLPLAKRYGASLIALCLDEKGIPETVEERVAIAQNILQRAQSLGIPQEDLYFDPLTLTAGADPQNPNITLATLERLTKMGLMSTMGVSNVSYGLPNRSLINRAFLAQAIGCGLTAPILNPNAPELMSIFQASLLMKGYSVLERLTERQVVQENPVVVALITKDIEGLWTLTEPALAEGAMSAIDKVLLPAMDIVGKRFKEGSLYLPQVMAASMAMQEVLKRLEPHLPQTGFKRGRVVLATVEGDVHDIGKNIVGNLLKTAGFEVEDLGKDVSPAKIVEAAHSADLVGLSALMTTTAPMIGITVEALRQHGLQVPVLVGGAVMNSSLARQYGASGYAADAIEAVEVALKLVEKVAR